MENLTPRQERFCEEYILDLNGTQAAMRAGYSRKAANEQSARLLAKVSVQRRISELKKSRSERVEITADKVLTEWAKLAFTDFPELADFKGGRVTIKDFDKLTPAQRACIKKFKIKTEVKLEYDEAGNPTPTPVDVVEIELHDKQAALINIGKHIGFYEADNKQQPAPIVTPYTDDQIDRIIHSIKESKKSKQ